MKKSPLLFLSLVALALCSFAMFESRETTGVTKLKYQQYLSLFDKVELPYQVALETGMFKMANTIGATFSHFHEGLGRTFSRVGPSEYYAEAHIFSNEKINVVLYSVIELRQGNRCSYYIHSIDNKGEIIDSQFLMDFYAGAKHSCQINKDLSIVISFGSEQESKTFQIHPAGRLEKINNKTAMAD